MAAAKLAKAANKEQAPPPAPPKATAFQPQQYTQPKPVQKKPLKKAEQYIFRKTGSINPILDKINIDFAWKAHTILPMTSNILWPYIISDTTRKPLQLVDNDRSLYDTDNIPRSDIQWLPRDIRYIHGANTPFKDEQDEQYGETLRRDTNGFNGILDNPQNRAALTMEGPELKVDANEYVLTHFLWMHGMCENIHPLARRRSTRLVYRLLDFGQIDKEKVELGKLKKAMYQIAGDAKLEEMIPHAKHLGIPFIIDATQQERDLDAIRQDYIEAALNNPVEFERTFRDPMIKIKHHIITLKEVGRLVISAGRARWAHSNATITLIPPDANPISFLADYSLMNKDFAEQLEASKIEL